MPITIEAVYEGGVLKPDRALPLNEREKVRVTIEHDADWRVGRVRATAGLLGWKGDAETVEQIALGPDFDVDAAP